MFKYLYYNYKTFRLVKPDITFYRAILLTIKSTYSFILQRFETLLFLYTGRFKYKTEVINKEILDEIYKKSGVVFFTTHSDLYPLLGKVYSDNYKDRNIIVTFYNHLKISVFKIFQEKYAKYGINVVSLGGAMKHIDPVLKNGGSMVLFLDAELPIKYTESVKIFNRQIQLTSGPYFLAKKYDLPIVPISIERKKGVLSIVIHNPIPYQNRTQIEVMQDIANKLESMILENLGSWQAFDKFLLNSIGDENLEAISPTFNTYRFLRRCYNFSLTVIAVIFRRF